MLKKLLVIGIVCGLSGPGVRAQQSSQGIEQEMLRRLAFQPRDLNAQLELIKIYVDSNRLADAEVLLTRALTQVREQRAAAPLAPGAQTEAPGRVRVGGGIQEPKLIRKVPPVYPPDALAARIEGIVIIEAVIDVNGAVKELKVLRSQPLLETAAVDAVRQWLFTPTLLNGVPVEVIMTLTVNFTLG